MCSDHVRSGGELPNAEEFTKKRSVTRFEQTSPGGGQKIRENKIYTTRDDQIYYTSNKVLMNQEKSARRPNQSHDFAGSFSKADQGKFVNRNDNSPYREALPSYLRLHEDGKYNLDKEKIAGNAGILTVMSRVNGWLTVEPGRSNNRKMPLEKKSPTNNPMGDQKHVTDQLDISMLSPVWMQRNQERGRHLIKKHNFEMGNTKSMLPSSAMRAESTRVFMVDKMQPARSVFSIGDCRHNVNSSSIPQALASKTGKLDLMPRRIDWNE